MTVCYQGKVQIASAHLWDYEKDEYNVPFVKRLLPGIHCSIIHLTYRTQGFYVAKGNPKKITGWEDLKREDIKIINRECGSGSRVLLDGKLCALMMILSSKEFQNQFAHAGGYDTTDMGKLTART